MVETLELRAISDRTEDKIIEEKVSVTSIVKAPLGGIFVAVQ